VLSQQTLSNLNSTIYILNKQLDKLLHCTFKSGINWWILTRLLCNTFCKVSSKVIVQLIELFSMHFMHASVDSYLKRKVCLYVFECLIGNVCTPFKNYFTRVSHNVNTRNRFSSIELPKMNLEFGRGSFSFLGASIFNSLPADIRTLNSRVLFRQKATNIFICNF